MASGVFEVSCLWLRVWLMSGIRAWEMRKKEDHREFKASLHYRELLTQKTNEQIQ